MPRHKHCDQCGLDFEPKQAWENYCSPTCLNDHTKTNPVTPHQYPPTLIPMPPYFPTTGGSPPTIIQYWHCGICGQAVPMNENHTHHITFTTGNP